MGKKSFVKGKTMSSFNEKYNKIKEQKSALSGAPDGTDSFSGDNGKSTGQDIYSSKNKRKKGNALVRRFRHLKRSLTVDFDKPFDFYDQVLIMFITLTVSCILFGTVFGVASVVQKGKNGGISVAASESSEESNSDSVHSAADTAKDKEVSKTESTVQTSETDIEEEPSGAKEPLFAETKTTVSNDKIHTGDLILVNKENKCYSDGENVEPLIEAGKVYCALTDNSVSFDKERIPYLNKMLEDFDKHYGDTDLMIACGYRSAKTQQGLLDNEIARVGRKKAEKWVAPPDYSEHQTGLAFDFNLNNSEGSGGIQYDGEDIYSWLNENCYKYGFIVRYPKGKEDITGYEEEPWHFRYVGEPSAYYIMQNNITLEEYTDTLKEHDIDHPLIIENDYGGKWCIYYRKASDDTKTKLIVPETAAFSVSGNNCDGFVVIVTLSESSYTDDSSDTENETSETDYSDDTQSDDNYSETETDYNDNDTYYGDDTGTDYNDNDTYYSDNTETNSEKPVFRSRWLN